MKNLIRLVILLMLGSGLGGCAAIFDSSTCSAPVGRWPAPSLVSVFVVPFEANSTNSIAQKAAEESARLIKIESIKTNADGAFKGFTLLSRGFTNRPCDAQQVMDAISAAQNREGVRLLSSSLVIWGIVVQRDEQLVSQLYAKILWSEEGQRLLQVNFPMPASQTISFSAQFPELTVAFPAKTIGTGVNGEFLVDSQALGIPRAEPSSAALAVDLPAKFSVGVRRAGWIQLVADDGRQVWLNAAPVKGVDGERLFAETDYFSAASAFLLDRHVDGRDPATMARLSKLLADYEHRYGRATDVDTRTLLAIVNLMVAFEEVSGATIQSDELSNEVKTHIDAAADLLPNNSEIANLAAMASIGDCCSGVDTARRVGDIQRRFEGAMQHDPANLPLLRNLDAWYSFLDQRGITPPDMTRDEMRGRQAQIRDRLLFDK